MNSLSFTFQTLITSNHDSLRYSNIHFRSSTIGYANAGSSSVGVNFKLRNCGLVSDRTRCSVSNSEDEVEGTVEEVMIPKEWMNPSKAAESDYGLSFLRGSLAESLARGMFGKDSGSKE
ncbi:hypothetical protein Tco_1288814 [Tanacetum coccineum]